MKNSVNNLGSKLLKCSYVYIEERNKKYEEGGDLLYLEQHNCACF
jgi:hypothetical protein